MLSEKEIEDAPRLKALSALLMKLLEGYTMSLVQKYVKLINDSSIQVTKFFLLIPPSIVVYLFFPNIEYTNRIIVSGAICIAIFSAHTAIGIHALIKKEYKTVLNFLLLPAVMACFVAYLGFK